MNAEIERIRDALAHYEERAPYADGDPTKEDLQETLARCEEVYDDLQIVEMKALWYLRYLQGGFAKMSGALCWLLPMAQKWYEEAQAARERRERGEPEEDEAPKEAEKSFYDTYIAVLDEPIKARLSALASYLNAGIAELQTIAEDCTDEGRGTLRGVYGLLIAAIQTITKEEEKQ